MSKRVSNTLRSHSLQFSHTGGKIDVAQQMPKFTTVDKDMGWYLRRM